MTDVVAASVADGVGTIRLTDPAHRNALSAAMSDALAAAVERVLAEEAGAIVLTADPPVFCAGGSLDGLLTREVPLADLYAGFLALARAPCPPSPPSGARPWALVSTSPWPVTW